MSLLLTALVLGTISMAVWRHGWVSFVTLGVFGAAIYAVPGLLDAQRTFSVQSQALFIATPDSADAVVAAAWCALLLGVALFSSSRPTQARRQATDEQASIHRLALATALLAGAGLAYLFFQQGAGVVVESRDSQLGSSFIYVWRWTAPIGLVASLLAGNRKLFYFHLFILFVIFLRGDRTFVAISLAAVIVASMWDKPAAYLFRLKYIMGVLLAGIGIFYGKSTYLNIKEALGGESARTQGLSVVEQLQFQFEPSATYAHVGHVMRRGLEIPFLEFVQSVFGNLLLIPSAFGVSTNVYNELVQGSVSYSVDTGIAGNYIAHGYVVAGIPGAMLFYLLLAWILRSCDVRFRKTSGTWKLFWACTGAVFAFYVHRNGLDNIFSFVRQIAVICVLIAITATALAPTRRERIPVAVPDRRLHPQGSLGKPVRPAAHPQQ